jgi:hypothetical protein
MKEVSQQAFKRFNEYYFQRTGRIIGCQSKNHAICRGELWKCERCGIKVCWEEGSMDKPELCDSCWHEVENLGVIWNKI